MSLHLADKWVWDSWYVDDGQHFHAYYLQASRALGDPDRRHWHVSVGHSVSRDLTNWTVVRDALAISDAPAPDDGTTWTGSVIRADDGTWWMFYTGTSRTGDREVQRILAATSTDLFVWEKVPGLVLEVDPSQYAVMDRPAFPYHDWRDPWVFRFPGQAEWHMLITAARRTPDPRDRGVIGHATSPDLRHWSVGEPLSAPGSGFGKLEVMQFCVVAEVPILLFCCGADELSAQLRGSEPGGVYSIPVRADLAGIDVTTAQWFDEPGLYAGRLVQGRDGQWNLLGFRDTVAGQFVGELCDPIPVTVDPVVGLVRR